MELLILLLQRRGDLVTREEIVARLWSTPESVDTVQGINTAVNRIRAVLKMTLRNRGSSKRLWGKGYRFIADEEEVTEIEDPVESIAAPSANFAEPFNSIRAMLRPITGTVNCFPFSEGTTRQLRK